MGSKKRIWNPETRCKRLQRVLWKAPGRMPKEGIYGLGRISRDFDVFLAPRPPWCLGAGPVWKQKEDMKPQNPLQRVSFLGNPDRMPEGGIYVLGRISRYFDVFLRSGPWDNLDPGAGF